MLVREAKTGIQSTYFIFIRSFFHISPIFNYSYTHWILKEDVKMIKNENNSFNKDTIYWNC